jgi:two-component system, sensor histidine kinase and response regulator
MTAAQAANQPYALVLLDCHMPQMDGFTFVERIKQDLPRTNTMIMMLTSGGQSSDAARCRDLGIASYLLKPIKQSELLQSVLRALEMVPVEPARSVAAPIAIAPNPGRSLRILIAEDNVVNQRLAMRLLEKRGHTATVVGNGREAVRALENDRFDLVLMDVEMPQMSGIEATAAIRSKELDTGDHIPIIATTAHAMKGDRERCLEAGMDDYVSKPIQAEQLFTTIDRLVAASKRNEVERSVDAILDPEATMPTLEELDWTATNIPAAFSLPEL